MNVPESTASPGLARVGQAGIVIAVIGLVGLLIGFVAHIPPKTLLQGYLYGWVFGMLFALGCYGLMLFCYMVQATWSRPIVRLLEAGAKTLPVMFVLFIPVLVGYQTIYPWANHDLMFGNPALGIKPDEALHHRAGYMNITMFAFRTVIYFIIWSLFTFVLSASSKRQDATHDPRLALYRLRMGAFALLVFFVTVTLAFTDWVMSLDAHWFSTLYGFWFADFQGLTAMAFVSLIVTRFKLSRTEPYAAEVNPGVVRDLGNLLLMLTMVWAYFSASQWIIIWSGNLPEEIAFYLKRNADAFLLIGAADIIFSFFVPFLLLLNGYHRRSPQQLARIALLILIVRVMDLYWVVMPATRHPMSVVGTDFAGLLFAFGVFLFTFSRFTRENRLIPEHDAPQMQEVLSHG